MAPKTTLNEKNLATLSAERLAALVMEVVAGNAALKRQARAALLENAGGDALAMEVRKRLATLRRSTSRVSWRKRPALVKDLSQQRRMIADKIAPTDPGVGLELMWQFMELADSVHDRADDSKGDISDVFRQGCAALGVIAKTAQPDPVTLADQVFHALFERNGYAQYDGLIDAMTPVLGETGLARLKEQALDAQKKLAADKPEPKSGSVIDWSQSVSIRGGNFRHAARTRRIEYLLQEIADAQGDVDAFIAGYDDETRAMPMVAAAIAFRLVSAGRAGDALNALDDADLSKADGGILEWTDARIAALEGLDRTQEAQAQRLDHFEKALSADHLREYLQRLSDFEDVEAEERALDHVALHADIHAALAFLTGWPDLRRAADLVMRERERWDGNRWYFLPDVAQVLAGRHPLAATVLFRISILDALNGGKTKRYVHAVRHLMECESLAPAINDYDTLAPHDEFVAALRNDHSRKSGFWSLLPSD